MSIAITSIFILALMILPLILKGPSVWDRILGFNLFSAKFISLILLYSIIKDQSYLLDLAFVYALLGFISIVFITRFIQSKGDI